MTMDNNNTGYFGGVANGVISTDVNTNYVHHVPVENRIDGGDSSEPGPSDICIRDRIVTYDTDTQAVDIDVVAADDRTIKTPITELDIFLAGILVTDAINARHGYFKHGENELRLYYLYHHWILRWIIYFFIAIILSLALFEYPAATDVMLPYWSTMMLELVCIAAFIGRLVHSKLFTSGVIWWSDWKNLTVIIAIALTFVDMVLYIVFTENGIYMVRWSRLFRPLYLINITHNRQMRRAFRNIRRTLPDICVVLILYLLLVALFALMALKMFENRNLKHRSGEPYMSDYWDNYYALYIYVTTANSPDVMMPAYDHNYWFCLFFIAYLIICYYIFMSVILAVIYNNYRKHLKTEVKKSVFQRRRLLSKAFNILKVKINGCFVCTMGHFQAIMKHVCPKASPDRINLLWNVLDELDNKYIKKKEFLKLYDLLNVPLLEEKDQKTFLERTVPSFYLSRPSLLIQRMVVHKAFHWVFDALIIINAVFIAFSIEESEWFFLTIFSIEIFLKLYTMGHKEFFRRAWNIFDFIVIFSAVILSFVQLLRTESALVAEQTLDVLMVLRVMRLFKPLGNLKHFSVLTMTIRNILPSLLTYGGVIFVFYYTFAILGMELFNGKFDYYGYPDENGTMPDGQPLYCGNEKLKDSDFWTMQYCSNNFNDIMRSFVLLFELTVVNQWHILASGYVLTTSTWARLFFVVFHLSVVIVLMNIFVAFVLEVFILRYQLNISGKGKHENAIVKKIAEMGFHMQKSQRIRKRREDVDDLVNNMEEGNELPNIESGLRFRLSKSGIKNVEVLLQQLFETELDEDGEEDNVDLDDLQSQDIFPNPVTMDNTI